MGGCIKVPEEHQGDEKIYQRRNEGNTFNNIGFLLIILVISSWGKKVPNWRYILLGVFLTLFIFGIFNGTYSNPINLITSIEIPQMKNMRFLPGTVPLGRFVENEFGISQKILKDNLSIFFPLITSGILIPLISWVLKKGIFHKLELYQVIMI